MLLTEMIRTCQKLQKLYGDKFTLVDRPQKHRYVYINTKCKKKKI